MKRSLLAAAVAVAAAAVLAACGSPAAPSPAAAAPTAAATSSAAAPATAPAQPAPAGVPALTGTPTDLTKPTQAQAGTGTPPAGLVMQDVVVGTGPAAAPTNTVDVRYTGTLYTDGSVFDSSWSRGSDPISFPLNRVVKGFSQGIAGMQAGGRRVLVIPPALGYGDQTNGPIPGGSTLVFVVDLVKIS
ncbi:FKBP-type peptidyl-prolyl cis-trans isomerase [Pseudonocardia sp. GCM10023141]|uniref:FKBP-type peptidyl-prolyl cis-trans isomerase n=1 Tax=Pseudonocardia sp. GCM10023141 TaxID=3252653 RepID=UPI00361D2D06